MFLSLSLNWVDFLPCSLLSNSPLSQIHWMLEKLGDQILYLIGVSLFLQCCPTVRLVHQNKSCTISFLIQVPRMTNDRKETCEHTSELQQNSDHILLYFRFIPMSLNFDMKMILPWKMLRFTLYSFHKFLNLFEDAQRRKSWEDFPLELRLHAIETIQFLEVVVLRIPFDFTHPSCVWVTSHLAHAKY